MDVPCPDLATVYAQHRARLVRFLTAAFGASDAEDIAQETMLRLHARPAVLADLTDPWPWLVVVARNVGRDNVRQNTRMAATDPAVLAELARDGDAVGASDEHLSLAAVSSLSCALDRMRPDERTLLTMRWLQGRSVEEIAAIVGLSPGAARQWLHRARGRLARAYHAVQREARSTSDTCYCGGADCRAAPGTH